MLKQKENQLSVKAISILQVPQSNYHNKNHKNRIKSIRLDQNKLEGIKETFDNHSINNSFVLKEIENKEVSNPEEIKKRSLKKYHNEISKPDGDLDRSPRINVYELKECMSFRMSCPLDMGGTPSNYRIHSQSRLTHKLKPNTVSRNRSLQSSTRLSVSEKEEKLGKLGLKGHISVNLSEKSKKKNIFLMRGNKKMEETKEKKDIYSRLRDIIFSLRNEHF